MSRKVVFIIIFWYLSSSRIYRIQSFLILVSYIFVLFLIPFCLMPFPSYYTIKSCNISCSISTPGTVRCSSFSTQRPLSSLYTGHIKHPSHTITSIISVRENTLLLTVHLIIIIYASSVQLPGKVLHQRNYYIKTEKETHKTKMQTPCNQHLQFIKDVEGVSLAAVA